MGIGTSIFLLAVGAILTFAVTASVAGIEISTVGVILMAAGALGLIISLLVMSQARTRERYVEREPRYVERDPLA